MILCIPKRGGVDLEREMVGLKDEFEQTTLRTKKVGASDNQMNLLVHQMMAK